MKLSPRTALGTWDTSGKKPNKVLAALEPACGWGSLLSRLRPTVPSVPRATQHKSGTVPVMGTSGGRRAVGNASLPRSVLSGELEEGSKLTWKPPKSLVLGPCSSKDPMELEARDWGSRMSASITSVLEM